MVLIFKFSIEMYLKKYGKDDWGNLNNLLARKMFPYIFELNLSLLNVFFIEVAWYIERENGVRRSKFNLI